MVDHNNPQSRNEEILIATIDGKEYNKLPQSRIEELLLELKEVIEAGSGGGGIKPIGVTTTPLYDGATTNPIQINGESYTAETGDMVTYQSTEFLFNVNEVWQELGDVSVVLAIIDDIFADIAPAFSATSTYAVGDYVIYDDHLYKCTTAHTGAWSLLDFVATTLSDEIKNKQNVLTAGSHIAINNDEISVNRWAVPAGKVVYTVITSDENYGQNVHVQRHTVDGGFIDDRTFTCVIYQTVNIDDLISIRNPYSSFNITLLEDSDEQQSGYSYTVNPITTPTSNSFTFTLPQEENDNDLIIREELDAVSEKLPTVPSTDGTYVLTATVTNGEAVYSWESNNGLTQEQINALIALLD